ncbi:MAG: DUF6544 family protein [Arenibacterium sp.]
MKVILLSIAGFGLIALMFLFGWRMIDHRADGVEMGRLLSIQPKDPERFSKGMVADLPAPARRYFAFAIVEGTPLHTVARIDMVGRFASGTKEAPNYVDMNAVQVLALPNGFVWKMSATSGRLRMSGSDGAGWTRFWLAGLVPVARFGGTMDHRRAAFGRYTAEAVFWTPAALLPGPGVTWEPVSETVARVIVRHDGLEQAVDVTVDTMGRPVEVVFPRWSDANPEKVYQLQPFGGYLSEFREFGGFRLPTHVEAGNFFGTDDYFPFFIADITAIRFP